MRRLSLLPFLLVAPACASLRTGAGVVVDTQGGVAGQASVGVGFGYVSEKRRLLLFGEEGGIGPTADGMAWNALLAVDRVTLPDETGPMWRVGGRLGIRGARPEYVRGAIAIGPRAAALWAFAHSVGRDDGEKFQLFSGTIQVWHAVGLEGGFDLNPLPIDGAPEGFFSLTAAYELTSRYQ